MPSVPFALRRRLIGAACVLLTGLALTAIIGPVLSRGLDRNQQCVFNLAQISHGVLTYAQDYDEKLPQTTAFSSIANFKSVVGYYVTGQNAVNADNAYRCPDNGGAYYTLNAALGGTVLAALPRDFYTIEVARDSKPHPDGNPNIGFLDGHAERNGVSQTPTDLACRQNARSVALGDSQYIQDYDEHYPFQTNDDAFRQSLTPYTKSLRVFVCPDTQQPYNIAQGFRGMARAAFSDSSKVVFLQDSISHKNGIVTTAYLDGHVEQRGPDGSLLPPPPDGSTGLTGQQISLNNINQLSLATVEYTQDYDEWMPIYHNYSDLLLLLTPYVDLYDSNGAPKFNAPTYQVDPAYSGVALSSVPSTANAIFLEDAYDFGDGLITAGYLDGHAARIPKPQQRKSAVPPAPRRRKR